MQYNDSGGATRYEAKPTPIDFRCDVDRVITKCVLPEFMPIFRAAYIDYDSEDEIDIGMNAQKLLGDRQHNTEQGLGAEFIRRNLYPTSGNKGYFHTIRRMHAG